MRLYLLRATRLSARFWANQRLQDIQISCMQPDSVLNFRQIRDYKELYISCMQPDSVLVFGLIRDDKETFPFAGYGQRTLLYCLDGARAASTQCPSLSTPSATRRQALQAISPPLCALCNLQAQMLRGVGRRRASTSEDAAQPIA